MEAIGSIGLAASLLQFIDFSSKLISNSSEFYRSNDGLLDENRQIETATGHLVLLNTKVKEAAVSASDEPLNRLTESCKATADELIVALNRLKIHDSHGRRKAFRKALQAVWCKEEISQLEARLSRFRNELNLHILVDLRKQILQLDLRASNQVEHLDVAARNLHEALIEKRDVFKFVNDSLAEQSSQIVNSRVEITSQIIDEHRNTRRELLESVRAENAQTRRIIAEIQGSRTSNASSCWLVPLSRNSHFVGRVSEIEDLEARLFQKDQCSRTAVMGLGGIGKTQVALELAYRIRDRYSEYSIFWVPALSYESIRQAYVGIARKLGIAQVGFEDEDVLGLVQSYLSQSNSRPWLLIIDNADDPEMFFDSADSHTKVLRLTNILPKSNGSSIILTTRSRKTAVRFANSDIIHLSELDGSMAIDLLNQSVINRIIFEESQVVMQLLTVLTFLPLAIVQAAAYINENDITATDYLSLLQSQEDIVEILSEDFVDEGRYGDLKNPVATTWLVSFQQIRTREPLAADYLSFMSCLNPKAIPKSLLPPAPTRKKGIDAFGLLSAYSFISQRPTDSSFDLHRLVHLAMHSWLKKQGILSEWVKRVIKRMVEVFPDSNEKNRTRWRRYIVHVYHIQESLEFQESIQDYLPFLRRYEKCLLKDGRWAEAEKTLNQQVQVAEDVFGKEHPFTLNCKTDLALTRGKRGHWEEAVERLRQIIKIQERVLEPGHTDLLTTVGNLAIFYSNMGLYEKAEELNIEILSSYGPILGIYNLHILECQNNLAMVYSLQGWYEKSVQLHQEVLNIRERVLGSAHPNTLQSLSSLSFVYLNQGLMEKAIDTGLHALKMKKMVLGQEHPDILINIQNLAVAHDFLGDQRSALMYGETLVDLSSRVNGDRHPDTLRSLSILAIIYISMGKWDKSENLLHEARKGLEKSAGIDHPDTMGAIFGLVAQYSMQNRLKEAEKLAVPLLEQRQRVVGPEHPGTLVVMNELANIWKGQGHEKKARKLKKACLRLEERILGLEHHLTISCSNDLKEWREASSEPNRYGPCIYYSNEHPPQGREFDVGRSATGNINEAPVYNGLVLFNDSALGRAEDALFDIDFDKLHEDGIDFSKGFDALDDYSDKLLPQNLTRAKFEISRPQEKEPISAKRKEPGEELNYQIKPLSIGHHHTPQEGEAGQSSSKALKRDSDTRYGLWTKGWTNSAWPQEYVPPQLVHNPASVEAPQNKVEPMMRQKRTGRHLSLSSAIPDPASATVLPSKDEIMIRREDIKSQGSPKDSMRGSRRDGNPAIMAPPPVPSPASLETPQIKDESMMNKKRTEPQESLPKMRLTGSSHVVSPKESEYVPKNPPKSVQAPRDEPALIEYSNAPLCPSIYSPQDSSFSILSMNHFSEVQQYSQYQQVALIPSPPSNAPLNRYTADFNPNQAHQADLAPLYHKWKLNPQAAKFKPNQAQQSLPYHQTKSHPQATKTSQITRKVPLRQPAPYKSALAYFSFSGTTKVTLILSDSDS